MQLKKNSNVKKEKKKTPKYTKQALHEYIEVFFFVLFLIHKRSYKSLTAIPQGFCLYLDPIQINLLFLRLGYLRKIFFGRRL